MTFLAYRVTETESGMTATWESREDDQLPAGDVPKPQVQMDKTSITLQLRIMLSLTMSQWVM